MRIDRIGEASALQGRTAVSEIGRIAQLVRLFRRPGQANGSRE
jgi:hypothetical protein